MEEVEPIYVEVGRLIRKHRKRANLTQAQLGSKTGLSRTTVTHIESGDQRIQLHTLYAIADALMISPQTLFPSVGRIERMSCKICEFDFTEVYGDLERLKALNPKPYKLIFSKGIESENDMGLLCLNCSHVLKSCPTLTPESFHKRVKKNKLNKI
jgi:transcriptional regulator with XRE-family HTH domain